MNLFTSSVFMVFTIVFLNMLFNAREEGEWKAVRDYVERSIQEELGALFNALLDYIEGGLTIKLSIMSQEDAKTANKIAYSELQRLMNLEKLKVNEAEVAVFWRHKKEFDVFSEVSKNLNEIQIKYSRFLPPPQITLSLLKIRDCMRSLEYMALMQSTQKDLELPDALKALRDDLLKTLVETFPKIASVSFKILLREIDNIHRMGIRFSPRIA